MGISHEVCVQADGKVPVQQDQVSWESELPAHATCLCFQDLLELISLPLLSGMFLHISNFIFCLFELMLNS